MTEEHEVKIKMVQEQWLQLNIYWVISWGGINFWWGESTGGGGGFFQVGEDNQIFGRWMVDGGGGYFPPPQSLH